MGCNMGRYFVSINSNKIAAIGVGSMVVFIAMVLIAGIAASVIIQTGNKLEIQAMISGDQTTTDVCTGIRVVDIEGQYGTRNMPYNESTCLWWNQSYHRDTNAIGEDPGQNKMWHNYSRLHNLTILVTPRAGSYDIDLSTTILEISNSTVKCILKYIGTTTNPNFAENVDATGVFQTTDTYSMFRQRANSFGIIQIEDADNSCSATNPVINRGDMIMLCINLSACFWGVDERTDVWGTIMPEEGAIALFEFSVPGFSSDTVYKLY